MRPVAKAIFLSVLLFYGGIAYGAMRSVLQVTTDISGGGTDADATAWAAQVVSNGGTVSAPRLALVSTMITGMKADGFWSKLDILYFLAAENTQSALVDMVQRKTATLRGAPTFTTDRGYVGSGSDNIVGTYTYTSTGPNMTTNSTMAAGYINVDNAGLGTVIGEAVGYNGYWLLSSHDGGFYAKHGSNTALSVANATALGFYLVTRTASNLTTAYKNGASITSNAATPLADNAPLWCALTADRHAMCAAGGAFTATDVTNFYNRTLTYLTAIGAN